MTPGSTTLSTLHNPRSSSNPSPPTHYIYSCQDPRRTTNIDRSPWSDPHRKLGSNPLPRRLPSCQRCSSICLVRRWKLLCPTFLPDICLGQIDLAREEWHMMNPHTHMDSSSPWSPSYPSSPGCYPGSTQSSTSISPPRPSRSSWSTHGHQQISCFLLPSGTPGKLMDKKLWIFLHRPPCTPIYTSDTSPVRSSHRLPLVPRCHRCTLCRPRWWTSPIHIFLWLH